jgi:hypothetical protein
MGLQGHHNQERADVILAELVAENSKKVFQEFGSFGIARRTLTWPCAGGDPGQPGETRPQILNATVNLWTSLELLKCRRNTTGRDQGRSARRSIAWASAPTANTPNKSVNSNQGRIAHV